MKIYCESCDDFVMYEVHETTLSQEIHEAVISYKGKKATCCKCGEEVWVKQIHDSNLLALNKAYRAYIERSKNIISNDEIIKLMEMYDIGKCPLAKLLGWSEVTIIRYLNNNTIPNAEYSKQLRKLFNPIYMKQLLDEKGTKLTPIAFKKCADRVERLIIESEDNYIRENEERNKDICNEIENIWSNIGISQQQKLSYYLQQNKIGIREFLNRAIDNLCTKV